MSPLRLLLPLCLFLACFLPGIALAADVTVTATNSFTFDVADVTITVGDTVFWVTLQALFHNVGETDGPADNLWNGVGFYSGAPGAVDSFDHTFDTAGTFFYVCESHGAALGMRGSVTVEEPPPVPMIAVISPNGGEDWAAGTANDIMWDATDVNGTVDITLLKAGGEVRVLTSDPLGTDGVWSWSIPADETPDVDYGIRVTDSADATVTDDSDADFTISAAAASITVISPNGGESWAAGAAHDITWTSTSVAGPVRIFLRKGGMFVKALTTATPAVFGTWTWLTSAGELPATDYSIHIVSIFQPTISDNSDADFAITGPEGTITVTSPNGGENWQRGTAQNITWTSSGVFGPVRIFLLRDGNIVRLLVPGVPAASGTFTWNIPAASPPANNLRVRVLSLVNPLATDDSDGDFAVTP